LLLLSFLYLLLLLFLLAVQCQVVCCAGIRQQAAGGKRHHQRWLSIVVWLFCVAFCVCANCRDSGIDYSTNSSNNNNGKYMKETYNKGIWLVKRFKLNCLVGFKSKYLTKKEMKCV